jgi:hypothetical protein
MSNICLVLQTQVNFDECSQFYGALGSIAVLAAMKSARFANCRITLASSIKMEPVFLQ